MSKSVLNEGLIQRALQSIYNALNKGVSVSKKKVADPELQQLLLKAEEAHKSLEAYMDEYYRQNPGEKKQADFLKSRVFTR